jgi:hypothetical protein
MAAVRRSSPGSPKPAGVWIPLRQRQRPGEPPIKRRPELRLRCRQCFCVALHRVADCAVEGDRVDAPPPGCRRGCLMQQVDARQAGLPRIYRSPGTRGCGSASLSVRRGAACGTPERPDSAYILGMNESVSVPRFYFDPDHDTNDRKPWSEMDKFDLRAAVESGNTPEEAAGFLCRSGTVEEVKRRADAMGLKWRDRD